MPGLWPPSHQVMTVGILSRREDMETWSGLKTLCPNVRGVGCQHTYAQPQPICHWASREPEKVCLLSYLRPTGRR